MTPCGVGKDGRIGRQGGNLLPHINQGSTIPNTTNPENDL